MPRERARSRGRPRTSRASARRRGRARTVRMQRAAARRSCWPPSSAHAELLEAERGHLQEKPAVREAADLRVAIGTGAIANRQVDDLHVEARRPEQEIKITERIEVA